MTWVLSTPKGESLCTAYWVLVGHLYDFRPLLTEATGATGVVAITAQAGARTFEHPSQCFS